MALLPVVSSTTRLLLHALLFSVVFFRPPVFAVQGDPCRGRKGSWGLRSLGSCGSLHQHTPSARTSPRREAGLARVSQSAGRVLPWLCQKAAAHGSNVDMSCRERTACLGVYPPCNPGVALLDITAWPHPLVGLDGGWGAGGMNHKYI